jgi:hypothetical protein
MQINCHPEPSGVPPVEGLTTAEVRSLSEAEVYLTLIHNFCTATWEEQTDKISAGSFQVGGLTISTSGDYLTVCNVHYSLSTVHCSVGIYTVLENVKRVIYFGIDKTK